MVMARVPPGSANVMEQRRLCHHALAPRRARSHTYSLGAGRGPRPQSRRPGIASIDLMRIVFAVLLFWCSAASAQGLSKPVPAATVSSPGKVLTVTLGLNEGRLSYEVARYGVPVIGPSR